MIIQTWTSVIKRTIQNVTSPNSDEHDGYAIESTMLLPIFSFHFGVIMTIWFAKSSPSYG